MAEPVRWQDQWWHQQPDGSWLRFNEQTQSWEPHGAVVAQQTGMSGGAKAAIAVAISLGLIFIIAILAAIAIPVFLRQREKGWESQVTSALTNAATAEESFYVGNNYYTHSVVDLQTSEGLSTPPPVQLTVAYADGVRYCIEAQHLELPNRIWSLDSTVRVPREGPCL
jgi:type IV pilus assembly protein PilA